MPANRFGGEGTIRSKKKRNARKILPVPRPETAPGERDKLVMGFPPKDLTDEDLEYIKEEQERYEVFLKRHGTRAYVEEAIRTTILMRHNTRKVAEVESRFEHQDDEDGRLRAMKILDKERADLMKRHTQALEALGALPKETMQDVDRDETIGDIYVRYIGEIKALKARGQRVGEPSAEARNLLRRDGQDPGEFIRRDVVPDDVRDAEIQAYEEKVEHERSLNCNNG